MICSKTQLNQGEELTSLLSTCSETLQRLWRKSVLSGVQSVGDPTGDLQGCSSLLLFWEKIFIRKCPWKNFHNMPTSSVASSFVELVALRAADVLCFCLFVFSGGELKGRRDQVDPLASRVVVQRGVPWECSEQEGAIKGHAILDWYFKT